MFRRSLGEDSTDRYNHTHSVIFFLLLALVTWLLPLNPYLQLHERQKTLDNTHTIIPNHEPSIKTTANCWCPPEFTHSMNNYANSVCESAFTRAINGQNSTTEVSLYEFRKEIPPSNDENDAIQFKPRLRSKVKKGQSIENRQPQSETLTKEEKEQQKKADDASHFIYVTTPTTLFLLALAVKIPHLLYSLLVGAFAGLNVDQILRAATSIAGPSTNDRQQIQKQLATRAIQHSGRTAGTLYLLLKLLACVSAVTSLLVVHGVMLPRASRLGDDLQANEVVTRSEGEVANAKMFPDNDDELSDFKTGKVLICEFPIRMLQNMQSWSLQCVFSLEEEITLMEPETMPDVKRVTVSSRASWRLYVTLFVAVQTFLVALTVVNVSSFVLWVGRLVLPQCQKFVPSQANDEPLTLDVVFLLQMARENVDPEVVQTFAQSGASLTDGNGSEMLPLKD